MFENSPGRKRYIEKHFLRPKKTYQMGHSGPLKKNVAMLLSRYAVNTAGFSGWPAISSRASIIEGESLGFRTRMISFYSTFGKYKQKKRIKLCPRNLDPVIRTIPLRMSDADNNGSGFFRSGSRGRWRELPEDVEHLQECHPSGKVIQGTIVYVAAEVLVAKVLCKIMKADNKSIMELAQCILFH